MAHSGGYWERTLSPKPLTRKGGGTKEPQEEERVEGTAKKIGTETTRTEKITERPEAIAGGDNFRGDNSGGDDGREKGRGGTRREGGNMVIVEDEKRSENMSVFITPNSERYCWRRS